MRKLSDKTHGIGKQNLRAVGKREAARGGVERGEKLVLRQKRAIRKRVYQRRLTRVRVTHYRRSRHGHAHTPLALHTAHSGDFFKLDFQLGNAFADKTPVKLELAFAAAALGYAAAPLPVEVRPRAVQARKRVFKLCKLHLQTGLSRLGAGCENVQNDLLPVDDFQIRSVLPVALLRGRKLVVEDNAVGVYPASRCDN